MREVAGGVVPEGYGVSGGVNLLTHPEKHFPASVSLILERLGIPSTVRVARPASWSALTIMRTVVGLRNSSSNHIVFSRHSINAWPFPVSITSVCGGAERVFSVLRSPSSLSSLTYSWTVFHLRSSSSAIWDMGLGPSFTDLSIASARLSVSTILPTKTPLNTGSGRILGVCINNRVNVESIVLNSLMFKRLNGDKKNVGFWGDWIA